jgi:acetyl-CoA C-acetyltransferase
MERVVLAGVGQFTSRSKKLEDALEPLALIERAFEAMDTELGGRAPRELDVLAVVNMIAWDYGDAPELLKSRLALSAKKALYTTISGHTPQWLVGDIACRIQKGEASSALIVGAEAMHSVSLFNKARTPIPWTKTRQTIPHFGDSRQPLKDEEVNHQAFLPIQIYPLFENALRAKRGWSLEDHRAFLGRLCARFAAIAKEHPYAWFQDGKSADEIRTVTKVNRMVGFPYTKYMNAIMNVDMAACLLVLSETKAKELGILEEHWVYLHGCSEVSDRWFVTDREDYAFSPAIGLGAQEALKIAHTEPQALSHLDFYSCFPCAPQVAAESLGIPLEGLRPLTVTGGLSYFGGPGNNYVTHALATMTELLRKDVDAFGMVSGMGWFFTRHSFGVYSKKRPGDWPVVASKDALQRQIDAMAKPLFIPRPEGEAAIETYTVIHAPTGEPDYAIVIGRDKNGSRFIANDAQDMEFLNFLEDNEGVGLKGTVRFDERLGRNVFRPS